MVGRSGDRKGEPILRRGVEGRLADCRFAGSNFAICCRTCRSSRDRSASACCNSLRNFPDGPPVIPEAYQLLAPLVLAELRGGRRLRHRRADEPVLRLDGARRAAGDAASWTGTSELGILKLENSDPLQESLDLRFVPCHQWRGAAPRCARRSRGPDSVPNGAPTHRNLTICVRVGVRHTRTFCRRLNWCWRKRTVGWARQTL